MSSCGKANIVSVLKANSKVRPMMVLTNAGTGAEVYEARTVRGPTNVRYSLAGLKTNTPGDHRERIGKMMVACLSQHLTIR